ncbi:MAG: hypothetical protein KGI51_04035 [Rhodospirillales bacterium]|nr:hypothetical protein [Rhodospirillales bacterium]
MAGNAAQDEWVSRVLQISLKGRGGTAEQSSVESEGEDAFGSDLEDLGLDAGDIWKAARDAFQQAADSVDTQLSLLQKELRSSDETDLQEIAEFGLNGLTRNTRVPLMTALREAGDGSAALLKKAAPKIETAATAFIKQLSGDPRIVACDDNPFGVPVTILATYQDAVTQLLNAVRLASRA